MKHFKLGFLAVIAVVTVSLTAATKADAFKPTSVYTCRAGIDAVAIELANGNRFYNAARTSDPGSASDLCPGESTNICVDLLTVLPAGNSFNCTAGTNLFCCAEITTVQDCTDPDYDTKVNIYCKQ